MSRRHPIRLLLQNRLNRLVKTPLRLRALHQPQKATFRRRPIRTMWRPSNSPNRQPTE